MDKKSITVAEAGKLGGRKTASTHRRKGGQKVSEERGPEFFSEIGKEGGSERAKQHEEARGKVSLEEAGRRGGQRVKRLIELGKKIEKE